MDDEWSLFDVRDKTEFGPVRDMIVAPVSTRDVDAFCQRWHYTHHKGTALWNYGLWDGPTLIAVVSYNLPSMTASSAVFGKDHWDWVLHMGRLVAPDDTPKNIESRLISGSLKLLKGRRPTTRAVLTFADTGEDHIGYVYQATNALYCGITAPEHYYIDTDGFRRSHKQQEGPNRNGNLSQSKAIARGWTVHHGPGKHRYLYLLGSKTERKESLRLLKYESLPYPKADGADTPGRIVQKD